MHQQGGTQNWSGDEGGSPDSSGHGSSYFSGEVLHSKDSPLTAQVRQGSLRCVACSELGGSEPFENLN